MGVGYPPGEDASPILWSTGSVILFAVIHGKPVAIYGVSKHDLVNATSIPWKPHCRNRPRRLNDVIVASTSIIGWGVPVLLENGMNGVP